MSGIAYHEKRLTFLADSSKSYQQRLIVKSK